MTDQQPRQRVDINWVQTLGGALAAVSSAVLLSTVGVAGTLIGAALGSVVATACGAIYTHYLDVTRERVAKAQAAALERVGRARVSVDGAAYDVRRSGRIQTLRAQREVEQAGEELEQAERELQAATGGAASPAWREVLGGLPWKRITAVAAGIFVVAMGLILAFELLAGRSVSTYTGGTERDGARTSIPGLGAAPAQRPTPSETPTPTPSPTLSEEASPSVTTTPEPTESAEPSESPEPTPTPTATPTTAPPTTVAPTPSPVPSSTPTEPPVG